MNGGVLVSYEEAENLYFVFLQCFKVLLAENRFRVPQDCEKLSRTRTVQIMFFFHFQSN